MANNYYNFVIILIQNPANFTVGISRFVYYDRNI